MMNDYVFLEDIGRKVGDWGNEIVRGGHMNAASTRGRGATKMKRGSTRTKRDVLKLGLNPHNVLQKEDGAVDHRIQTACTRRFIERATI